MLALHLRLQIVLVLLACGIVAWLAGARAPAALAAFAVAGSAALVAIVVLAGYAIARISPLRGAATEFAVTAWDYLVVQPFPAPWLALDARAGQGPAVLLVHGYLCNRGAHWLLARRLRAAGYRVFAIDLEPLYAGIDTYVPSLAARIDAVLAATGRRQLAVVCHSMGGLVLRAYLATHDRSKVAVGVTLATPHNGTRHAAFGLGENARQMIPGSPWLDELARLEAGAKRTPLVSIRSSDDNLVAPQESSVLAGAENIEFHRIGHLALLCSKPVAARVVAALRKALPL